MAAPAPADEAHRVVSTAIDADFYRLAYPELGSDGLDPIRHYMVHGWLEGRDPAPWFSSKAYLAANPDVARSGQEPLHHFLTLGRSEGREVYPSRWGEGYLLDTARAGRTTAWRFALSRTDPEFLQLRDEGGQGEAAAALLAERLLVASEFDPEFYLNANGDVASASLDPLEHFLATGWREGRDPNPRFSVKDYLEAYPDVDAAGMNPFTHFLRAGRAEGRAPRNNLGFRYAVIAHLSTVDARVEGVLRAAAGIAADPAGVLAAGLARNRSGLTDLHVTFSHDDYTAHLGGLQLCLQREDAGLRALSRDHLHLHPVAAWPVVRPADSPGLLGVLLNGERIGVFAPDTVARTLADIPAAPGRRSFAVHSLLGHDPDETADILEAVGLRDGFFWLHDFASLCAGFHLMRNDVEDCGAPPPDSPACGICVYGDWRARHLAAHERLFARLGLTVVSPSQPTLDLWRRAWSFPTQGEVVLPHARLEPRGKARLVPDNQPFRLAYVGMPSTHKGWGVFRDLVQAHGDDPRYQFVHLGARTPGGLPLEFHPVSVSAAQPDAMQAAVERLDVDAVLMWPLCRETFSFAAYEAVAGGAAILTGPDSGNVAAFVQTGGHGRVLADETALAAAFADGTVTELSRRARRPMLYDLAFSGLTLDLLGGEGAA